MTPLKAIKNFCIKCLGGKKFVKECKVLQCFLYKYRNGKMNKGSKPTQKQMEALEKANMRLKETRDRSKTIHKSQES